ncbi:ribonuclease E/G family protein [Parerythrobacter jejuensis]|uniref:Ribonuclease n=1 Tax=Parerythrobacter jejuensis TaxID=795812 RepID=A0A845AQP0_9SPHN|nr:ribonuclease [Parerythrobacter jejuensis]MXP31779.1 ribonuclease [Parerythrobacter jejuensis]
MPEWLTEHGIGETRSICIDKGEVIAAKLHWPGELVAGQAIPAKLVSRQSGSPRGVAKTDKGVEILLDKLPAHATEGKILPIHITRAPIAERGRHKRAQGRLILTDQEAQDRAHDVFLLGDSVRSFPAGLWEDVWTSAWDGEVAFDGGSLLFSVTPAMTLVDIDGDGSAKNLSLAAVPALSRSLQQFDLGGSIGIDFPTVADKAGRRAVDEALASALVHWPHERTAMNGFGFVQLVARLEGPSLLHRMATSRVGAAARMVLRQAERVEEPGTLQLTVHPAIKAKLKPEWLEELARRTGRQVSIITDPGLALGGGFAQAVPS